MLVRGVYCQDYSIKSFETELLHLELTRKGICARLFCVESVRVCRRRVCGECDGALAGSESPLRPAATSSSAATGAIPKSISFDKSAERAGRRNADEQARRGFFKNLKLPFKTRRKGSRELVSERCVLVGLGKMAPPRSARIVILIGFT